MLGHILCSAATCVAFYVGVRSLVPAIVTPRQRAWVTTLFSSSVCSLACIYPVTHYFLSDFPPQLLFSNDVLSEKTLQFFVGYLLADTFLLFADFYTVSLCNSTLLHHLPYLAFMVWALHVRVPSVFVLFFPLEFSTVILSWGYLFPQQRQTELLVLLFALFRVAYHAFLSWQLFLARSLSPIPLLWLFSALPLPMHVFWLVKLLRSLHQQPFVNSCVFSCCAFLGNAWLCFSSGQILYGYSFVGLFCTSLLFRCVPSPWTEKLDQIAVLVVVSLGATYLAAFSRPAAVTRFVVACFLATGLLFVVGKQWRLFCYTEVVQHQYYWHSALHGIACLGHLAICAY